MPLGSTGATNPRTNPGGRRITQMVWIHSDDCSLGEVDFMDPIVYPTHRTLHTCTRFRKRQRQSISNASSCGYAAIHLSGRNTIARSLWIPAISTPATAKFSCRTRNVLLQRIPPSTRERLVAPPVGLPYRRRQRCHRPAEQIEWQCRDLMASMPPFHHIAPWQRRCASYSLPAIAGMERISTRPTTRAYGAAELSQRSNSSARVLRRNPLTIRSSLKSSISRLRLRQTLPTWRLTSDMYNAVSAKVGRRPCLAYQRMGPVPRFSASSRSA